jgi:hypothetical protein
MAIDHLGLIDLSYGGGRHELSILHVCDNFAKLYSLLLDPFSYFKQGKEWNDNVPAFNLPSPLRIVLQWAGTTESLRNRFHGIVGSAQAIVSKGCKLEADSRDSVGLPLPPIDNGTFMVEFAKDTGIMFVTYGNPPDDNFDTLGATTAATRAFPSLSGIPLEDGHLHFDIGNTHEARAKFAFGYIKNPAGLIGSILQNSQLPGYYDCTCELIAKNSGLLPDPLQNPSSTPPVLTQKPNEYPFVVLEHVTSKSGLEPAGQICVDISIDSNDELGPVLIKRYV